jgi:hypothetical protein
MNTDILNQYQIHFEVVVEDKVKTLQVTSDIIPYLYGYFIKKYPEHLLEDILPEINNALSGNPFDSNGGGIFHFLEIGPTISSFEDDQYNKFDLPTSDVKEILISYIDWIIENNLEQYIQNN